MSKFKIFLSLGLAIFSAGFSAQSNSKRLLKDIQKVSGSWKGSLTYLDYSSGKPYSMPAEVIIYRIEKTNKFLFSNIYPNEKNANSTDTIIVSSDGKYIDNELVKSRRKLNNGDIEIITENIGKDGNDNKPATIKHTYIFGNKVLKKRKDVQFTGDTKWINRHEYSYSRN